MSTPAAPARPPRARITGWTLVALLIAGVVALPIATVLTGALRSSEGVWPHLWATVLPGYLANSALLVLGTVTLAALIGIGTGWLVAACDFPGRRMFEWALMLPLAMPGYVIAMVYLDRLSFAGPIQTWLRATFGWGRGDYWFPPVASLGGAVAILALVLFPYVYLLTRAAFLHQSAHLAEAARSLGHGPWGAFARIAVPMAWPAVAAGSTFVAMETLADYGTVQHLGVPTLTTGIFRTWFGRGSPVAAAQMAALLLAFVAVAFVLEHRLRAARRFADDPGGRARTRARVRLGPIAGAGAALACALPVLLGFALPAAELVRLHLIVGDPLWGPRFLTLATNSLGLAALTAAVLVSLAVFLAYAQRLHGGAAVTVAVQSAAFGYAMPGAVIAVGVLIPMAAFDNALDGWMRAAFGISTGLLLSGTLAALIFAYTVRYLAVALKTVEAGFARIPPSLSEAARSLGQGPRGALWRVDLPLLRPGLLAAAILVFADVMKELPATLIVRPFNFDTLAVRTFGLAQDGRIEEAATAALMIVAVGIGPVILLSRSLRGGRG